MTNNEISFVELLQKKAKQQATLDQTSPVPQWARPFLAVVGMKYWLMLFIVSLLLSIPVSVLFFPLIYTQVTGLP